MSKEENVINYYVLCNRLKNLIRKGWKDWNVNKERIESVAEHVYGTQMLALAMKSEYGYEDLDFTKVLFMLAIHELGESVIGDLTQFEISNKDKEKIEHKAVHNILEGLIDGEKIEELFLEFDSHKTKEALFAYECDKAECDIQCKLYGEAGYVDLTKQDNNSIMENERVKYYLDKGDDWSTMWIHFDLEKYPYDENFRKVLRYTLNNKISKNKKEEK